MIPSRILKHPLNSVGITKLQLPGSARFLTIKVQRNKPVAYFTHEQEDSGVNMHVFQAVLTGEQFEARRMHYVDTLLLEDDEFVIHVFKKI